MKMKRYGLYKRIFIPLLLFAGVAGSAWGQEENNPGEVKYGTEANAETEAKNRLPILSLEASLDPSNPNDSRNKVEHIWDGVVDGNSWCEFAKSGEVVLRTFMNSDYVVIEKILIYRGATEDESPVSITIQYGDEEKDEPDDEIIFSDLKQNDGGDNGKPLLLTLAEPIKNARFLAIILTPEEGANIALDEIMLLGKYMKVKHRTTKWGQLRDNGNYSDSFDDDVEMFYNTNSSVFEGLSMQPAHHYTDTIYMKRGDTRTLILPDRNTDATTYGDMNNKSYRRWYDYKTDGFTDALKPKEGDADVLMQIANGYLHLPHKHLDETNEDPKGQNTPTPYQIDFTYPTNGEDSYIIACDVSNYIDVNLDLSTIQPNDEGEYTFSEPTLSHRILYYIKAIPEGTMDANYYHEKYDISFPFTRISNHTLDIVALSKDADAYAFPDEADDTEGLTVEITGDNSAGIKLKAQKETDTWFTVTKEGKKATLSGNHRTISFAYPHTRESDGTQFVGESTDNGTTDNYTATITVKKGNYNIATYNLTFKRNTVLLTQSIISEIEKPEGTEERNDNWDDYYFRTPTYLSENYGSPLTELNWDYDKVTISSNYNNNYYPFPMDWSYSTYGFYDGSKAVGTTIASIRETPYPEWGHYGITNQYIETIWGGTQVDAPQTTLKNSDGENSSFHLYVDASDRPGTIARLTFPDILCAGSEIFVSAWVKSTSAWNGTGGGNNDDAAMLFTIMGVRNNEDGSVTRVPLYRHCTGQIRNTLYMKTSIPGCGENNNEWLQVYFSFINGTEHFDEYQLQVDNYSASSNGGDMYLDDVRCYVAKPTPRVTQQLLTCGEQTRVRMDLDWKQLISRTGDIELTGEESNTNNGIDFCFIDKELYESYLTEHPNDYAKALKQAAVTLGEKQGYGRKYGSLYYDLNYSKNKNYTVYTPGQADEGSLAINNPGKDEDSGKYFFYKATAKADDAPYTQGERLLSVDFYANMSQEKEYMMLIRDHKADTEGTKVDFSSFGNPDDDPCAIKADFTVQGQNLIRMNGKVVNPGDDNYCTGQIYNFTVDLQYYVNEEDKYETYEGDNVSFDWFFGTKEEFEAPSGENKEGPSLKKALAELRKVDTLATSKLKEQGRYELERTTTAELGDEYVFLIEKYLNEKAEAEADALQKKLVLCAKTLEIRILKDGLNLVVAPIQTEVEDKDNDTRALLCFEPMALSLKASNKAPQIQPGFEDVAYESEDYNPAMRIGLAQIKASSGEDGKEITVNLRNAKFALDSYDEDKKPDHIGLLYTDESQPADNPIYLIGSNDPALEAILNPTDGTTFDNQQYIIGTVTFLTAKPDATNTDENKMTIKFNYGQQMDATDDDSPKFEPREGYEYTFTVEIQEHNESHEDENNACRGNFNLTMKVVPEYLVWQGTNNTQNWNNDALWKRATKEQLKKSSSDEYKDYDDASTPGYVPMLFSKVIIPSSGKVELYQAGFEETNSEKSWQTDRPNHIVPPSMDEMGNHPIQYDMMVYTDNNGDMSTKPYRTPLCDHIHFEPGAEMLHAEYLQYDTAWVEYELEKDKWHTLASPLQAVVSGDWYTAKSGRQKTEYFDDITFEGSDYSRLAPEVYQRGWGRKATMIKTTTGENNSSVAVSGNWSGVYNDVNESFTPGSGFSVKVIDGETSGNNKALFRFPKSDTGYSYQSNENNGTSTDETSITRNNPGKLQSDDLNSDNASFTVKLQPAKGESSYFLVGNPFMTALNMKAFFDVNIALEKKYWHATDGIQDIVAANNDTWISTEDKDNVTIPPLQSFFVQKKAETVNSTTDTETTVTFNADMQVLSGSETGEGAITSALYLTATTADGRQSRAAIAYDGSASAGYEADEDAELFLDSNLSDVPAVYTVAGTMATSINRTSELWNIPVGVYGNDNETVTLSFSGLNGFSGAMFYDAEKKVETPLYEGKEIAVSANTGGRYFIRATAMPTANEPVIAHKSILIYSLGNGKALVTSEGNPLSTVRVYNMNGALIRQEKCSGNRHELHLPKGVYLIVANDSEGLQENGKVLLR